MLKQLFFIAAFGIFLSESAFGQSVEQKALNFFVDSIAEEEISGEYQLCLESKKVQKPMPQIYWVLAACYGEKDSTLFTLYQNSNKNPEFKSSSKNLKIPNEVSYGDKCGGYRDSVRLNLEIYKHINHDKKHYVIVKAFYEDLRGICGNDFIMVFKDNKFADYEKCSYT